LTVVAEAPGKNHQWKNPSQKKKLRQKHLGKARYDGLMRWNCPTRAYRTKESQRRSFFEIAYNNLSLKHQPVF